MSSAYQNHLSNCEFQLERIQVNWRLIQKEKLNNQGITAVQDEALMQLDFMRIILFWCAIIVMGASLL
jgi:hypothetical protein